MADLVFGVTKPLVLGTLNRAQLAIEEEAKFRKRAPRDLMYITEEFQVMHHVLSATMIQEDVESGVVSPLVTQVRDLAYDIEDGVEFIIHLDTKYDWLLRFTVPSCMRRKPLPLDEAVDTIERLKARVQDVSQRIERYKLITDSVSNSRKQNKQPAAEAGGSARNRKRQDMEALTKLITQENSSQVISVLVPGGDLASAKSIIKKAYDNWKRWGKFEFKAWVKLVRPFNLGEIIKSFLDQINASTHEEQHRQIHGTHAVETEEVYLDQVKLVREFNRKVNKKPCLFVLEVESLTVSEWNTILEHLPDNKGCRLFVSTQQFKTARMCTGYPCFQRFSMDLSHCVFIKEEGPLIGRVAEANQLRYLLTKARLEGLHVISLWGIPGAGKSALARNLYREKLWSSEFRRHIWVDVSHPFNLQDFCRSLLLQFHSDSLELEAYEGNVRQYNEDPVNECQDLLKEHRCLLVIDNLRSTEDWDSIHNALVFSSSGSVIIVITNEERTALHCADLVFNVKALEGEEAVRLFKRQIGQDGIVKMDRCPKELVSKCGGLPKVIVAVADYLGHAYDWMFRARILNRQFTDKLETMSELRDLLGWIHSYIRSGPDHLKPCIFYLSIFLQSPITRRRRLVMRWVAEGYPKDKTSDSAEELFTKITELSMIQPAERTIITDIRMVRCQINPFFQEYIISRTSEETFQKKRTAEENLTFALEVCALKGSTRQTTARTARHVVIEESWPRDQIAFDRILSENLGDRTLSLSRLRSVTVFGEWKSFFISEGMTVLRVLDLENAYGVTDEDLKKILELLPFLKFLSLRGCYGIENLPSSVGDQRQLQTLDLRHTSIVTLPASITKLKKLQYLRAGTTVPPADDPLGPHSVELKVSKLRRFLKPVGVEITTRVGKLTSLHTLGVVNVGAAEGKYILKGISNLTHLCKLGVFGVNKKNIKEFCNAIFGHSHLQSLSVWFNKDNLLDGTTFATASRTYLPRKLQSLKLYGLANKLPAWFYGSLSDIRKMNLEIDELSADDIAVIGLLKQLCVLRLRVTLTPPRDKLNLEFHIMSSGEERKSYKKLKILEIACGSGSLDVTIGEKAMENLQVLKAGCCNNGSVLQFTELKHLTNLMEVYVIRSSQDDTLTKHLEEKLDGHPSNPRFEKVALKGSPAEESTGGIVQLPPFPFYI